jgi:hypothetical protein
MDDCFCLHRGLHRLERRHRGATGLIVCGQFEPFVYWQSMPGWARVAVRLDGAQDNAIVLREAKRGPYWIDLMPGRHVIKFVGDGTHPLHEETLHLSAGNGWLIGFKAAIWRPFMSPTEPRWCSMAAW